MRGRVKSESEMIGDDSEEDEDDDEDEETSDGSEDDDYEDSIPTTPELSDGENKEPWSTYLCSCYESCDNCICVTLCLPFMLGEVMHYVFARPWHIAFLAGLALLPLAPCFLTVARVRIRRAHKLQGNIAVDAVCTNSCCFCCSACQIRDQIFFLREEKRWRLAFRTRQPDRSPYVKPFVDMGGDFKKYRNRKQAERVRAATRSSVATIDLEEASAVDASEERRTSKGKSDGAMASPKRQSQSSKPSPESQEVCVEVGLEESGPSRKKINDVTAASMSPHRARKPSEEHGAEERLGKKRANQEKLKDATASWKRQRQARIPSPDVQESHVDEELEKIGPSRRNINDFAASSMTPRRVRKPSHGSDERGVEERLEDRRANQEKSNDALASSKRQRKVRKPSPERQQLRVEDGLEEKGATPKPKDVTESSKRQRQARTPSRKRQEVRIDEELEEREPSRKKINDVTAASQSPHRVQKPAQEHSVEKRMEKRANQEKLNDATASSKRQQQARIPSPDDQESRAEDELEKNRPTKKKIYDVAESSMTPHKVQKPSIGFAEGGFKERSEDKRANQKKLNDAIVSSKRQVHKPSPELPEVGAKEASQENGPSQKMNDVVTSSVPPHRADKQTTKLEERGAENRREKTRENRKKANGATVSPKRRTGAQNASPASSPNRSS